MVVVGTDVISLYPSLVIKEVVGEVGRAILESDIKLETTWRGQVCNSKLVEEAMQGKPTKEDNTQEEGEQAWFDRSRATGSNQGRPGAVGVPEGEVDRGREETPDSH